MKDFFHDVRAKELYAVHTLAPCLPDRQAQLGNARAVTWHFTRPIAASEERNGNADHSHFVRAKTQYASHTSPIVHIVIHLVIHGVFPILKKT